MTTPNTPRGRLQRLRKIERYVDRYDMVAYVWIGCGVYGPRAWAYAGLGLLLARALVLMFLWRRTNKLDDQTAEDAPP